MENETTINPSWGLYDLNHPILNKEQEYYLIRLAQKGNPRAMDKLVKCNIKLVANIMFKMGLIAAFPDRKEDNLQNGILGLIRAIQKYDLESEFRLSTYATHWIRQSIQRPIDMGSFNNAISTPAHHSKIAGIIRRADRRFGDVNRANVWERYLQEVEISNISNEYARSQVEATYDFFMSTTFSGDAKLDLGGDESSCYWDVLAAEEPTTDDIVASSSTKGIVADILERSPLRKREKEIIIMRFGLGGIEKMTLEEIGSYFNITRERIRQVQNEALNKLKRHLSLDGITELTDLL